MAERLLVTGAGGFIGHHLVKYLVARGYWVRGADIKHPAYEPSPAHEFAIVDLRRPEACLTVTRDVGQIYHWPRHGHRTRHGRARQGGAQQHRNGRPCPGCGAAQPRPTISVRLVRLRLPTAAPGAGGATAAAEDDAWPADPQKGTASPSSSSRSCASTTRRTSAETRVARFHNVYGPLGSYDGGREKAPAAICRKIALAETGARSTSGATAQTRSFIYVDDCVEGLHRLMESDCSIPLNLDTGQMVTLDELAKIVADVAGKTVRIRHNQSMPRGARLQQRQCAAASRPRMGAAVS